MPTRQIDSIRELNDRFRTLVDISLGKWVATEGVSAAGDEFVALAIEAVRQFNVFTPDNDPHGEHDFGIVKIDNRTLYWKIDYYDPSYEFGSDDPADITKTRRVLTIMLASEY